MAVVPNENRAATMPIQDEVLTEKLDRQDSIRLMTLSPWIFALVFLFAALAMTFVPSVAEFFSNRVALLSFFVFGAFVLIGVMNFESKRVKIGLARYEKNLHESIRSGMAFTNPVATPYGLEGLSDAVNDLIDHVKGRHVESIEVATSNRVLVRELERVFLLLERVHDGVLILDNAGRILFANRGAEPVLSGPSNAAKGKAAKEYINEPEVRRLLNEQQADLKARGNRMIELAEDESIGRGPLAVYHSTGSDHDDHAIGQIIFVREIAQIKKIEKQQIEFVDNLSREIQVPLSNLLRSMGHVMHDGALEADERVRVQHEMYDECNRISMLVNSLVNMSLIDNGVDSLNIHDCSLLDILADCAQEAVMLAEREGVRFHHELPERLPNVAVDSKLMTIALCNILRNAVRYTPDGGEVFFSTSSNENELVLTVADTGAGMRAEKIETVFDRTFVDEASDDPLSRRTFALSTSNQIVQMHGGEIRVTSREGEGTQFAVILPRSIIQSAEG
jgi:signal transduction histidine kinase